MLRQRLTLIAGAVVVILAIVGSLLWWMKPGQAAAPTPTALPPQDGQLAWVVTPQVITATVNGQRMASPATLLPGEHSLVLFSPGYSAFTQLVTVESGKTTTVEGALVDDVSPLAILRASPAVISEGWSPTLTLYIADEGMGLASYYLDLNDKPLSDHYLDGEVVYQYALPLNGLGVGLHEITLGAVDQAGNRSEQSAWVEVGPKQVVIPDTLPEPGESIAAPGGLDAMESITQTATNTELDSPPVTVAQTVTNTELEITLNSACNILGQCFSLDSGDDREAAAPTSVITPTAPVPESTPPETTITTLARQIPVYDYTLVQSDNFPYPHPEGEVGPPMPQAFQSVMLENDSLRLAFLPELGGRLYQIIDIETGKDLLYTNPAIKPTRWGPEEMNWWLMVGGMEWAFPVEEHGYTWGQAWQYDTAALPDGGAEIALSYTDRVTQLEGTATVQLPPTGSTFTLTLQLANTGDVAQPGQLWFSAAFPAGPGMGVEFPAQHLRVHSTDDTTLKPGQLIASQSDLFEWGRWDAWFGGFAAPVTEGAMTIQGAGSDLALQRIFSPGDAPGVKFFAWGDAAPVEEWGGEPYFEIWGGLTADFDTFTILEPGQSQSWTDVWRIKNEE